MGFAERLREKRKEAGLTQKELAERCGLNVRTIYNYERGIRRPASFCSIQKIASTLNTSQEYLLQDCSVSGIDGSVHSDEVLARSAEKLTKRFLSGKVCEEQLDTAMKALWQAYWQARGVQ